MTGDRSANNRDAAYLAYQMRTNGRILALQGRLERARDALHQIYLEVAEEAGIAERTRKVSAEVPVPPLDRSVSTPRLAAATGTGSLPGASVFAFPVRSGG